MIPKQNVEEISGNMCYSVALARKWNFFQPGFITRIVFLCLSDLSLGYGTFWEAVKEDLKWLVLVIYKKKL